MSERPWEREPYPDPEGEGQPDLDDGTPEARWAEDPQEMPLPGDEPAGADDYGVTAEEQRTDEPLDQRLGREESDIEPHTEAGFDTEADAEVDAEVDTGTYAAEPPRPAGRLVEEDEGVHTDTESEAVAMEAAEDLGGRSPEERAMRVEPE